MTPKSFFNLFSFIIPVTIITLLKQYFTVFYLAFDDQNHTMYIQTRKQLT